MVKKIFSKILILWVIIHLTWFSYVEASNITSSQGVTFLTLKKTLDNKIKTSAIQKISDELFLELAPINYKYFLSLDSKLRNEYDKYSLAYYQVFINLEKYIKTKDINTKQIILSNLPLVIEWIKAKRDLELEYVNKNTIAWNIIYSPKNKRPLNSPYKIQTLIVEKLNSLILSETISLEEYNIAMNAYNYFILHLEIFIEFKSEDAKKKALEQVKIFTPTYNKTILSQSMK